VAVTETTAAAAGLDYAVAVTPISGEEVAADICVVKQFGERWLLAIIDGLGHGEAARRAAEVAQAVIEDSAQPHLATILTACDAAMKSTRGAVIGLGLIDYGQNTLTWLGVGNTAGKVVWRGDDGRLQESSLSSMPGVVGLGLPTLNQYVYRLQPGSLMIAFTDGLDDRWVFPENRWLFEMETEALAAHLMQSHYKETDDCLVAVARY